MKFRGVLDQLYSENTSEIIINDGITGKVSVGRGTRHGCPLSPVTFCLIIEMLADKIRNDESIIGLGNNVKINLFADDSLLIIRNPTESMNRIKCHSEKFGLITGLSINWQKS